MIEDQARFVEIMQMLSDGVLEIDSALRILYANPVACRLLGVSETEITGKSFPELLEADSASKWTDSIREASSPDTSSTLPVTIRMGDKFVKIEMKRATGDRLIALLHDATTEILKLEELQQQNLQLQHAKQELERRLTAIQVIQKLSRAVEYPYGHAEIVDAILRFVPQLIQQDASAALVQNPDGVKLHVFLSKDIGLDNFA